MKIKSKPIIHQPTPAILKCDFCSEQKVVCGFRAPDMTVGEYDAVTDELDPTWTSVGGWAACEVCAQMLEAGKLYELAERALFTSPDYAQILADGTKDALLVLLKSQYKNIIPKREAANASNNWTPSGPSDTYCKFCGRDTAICIASPCEQSGRRGKV